jgi:hypothetical protein
MRRSTTAEVPACPQCGKPNEEFGRELRLATRLPMAVGAGLLMWASIKFQMPWYAAPLIVLRGRPGVRYHGAVPTTVKPMPARGRRAGRR